MKMCHNDVSFPTCHKIKYACQNICMQIRFAKWSSPWHRWKSKPTPKQKKSMFYGSSSMIHILVIAKINNCIIYIAQTFSQD